MDQSRVKQEVVRSIVSQETMDTFPLTHNPQCGYYIHTMDRAERQDVLMDEREKCVCAVCGWEWLTRRGNPPPTRCVNQKCRSKRWRVAESEKPKRERTYEPME